MPIKLNGTTIFDESNFMKYINTNAAVNITVSAAYSYTTPSNGWIIITAVSGTGVQMGTNNTLLNSNHAGVAFPVCKNTTFQSSNANSIMNFTFCPELT